MHARYLHVYIAWFVRHEWRLDYGDERNKQYILAEQQIEISRQAALLIDIAKTFYYYQAPVPARSLSTVTGQAHLGQIVNVILVPPPYNLLSLSNLSIDRLVATITPTKFRNR